MNRVIKSMRKNIKKVVYLCIMQTIKLTQTYIETPLGALVALADNNYLYLLEFANNKSLSQKIAKLHADITPGKTPITDLIAQELHNYFAGTLTKFATPLHFTGTPFQKNVWQALQTIPHGQTYSYTQLAQLLNKPAARRAVARANGANAFIMVIPCHRVINSNGNLGGYSAGLERKQWLLKHESGSYYEETSNNF